MKNHPSASGGNTPRIAEPARHADHGPPVLLTPRHAARAISVSERTLFTLTKRGGLPCVRIGRSVRYDAADLRAFVERLKRCAIKESGVPS